ncbi:hypothetical protein SODALDRAFT_203306 [Sodiomyces alkalinus F11]|uniref:Uncharacterized protein n=1 Tax=Sodiomyces alkalinus (strain CBS 110278 / VKM F-3762 / F11) TaxID=1314773 RepID=A0A3N2PTP8_SODAK|nr:hypothetical protein SODALDRAFT_203306 [Sodiomyces alkalinus F11]ROT37696.1 hypothetical protein SODALDRAFT_203306 [Sodiomyces alkalinus F11]
MPGVVRHGSNMPLAAQSASFGNYSGTASPGPIVPPPGVLDLDWLFQLSTQHGHGAPSHLDQQIHHYPHYGTGQAQARGFPSNAVPTMHGGHRSNTTMAGTPSIPQVAQGAGRGQVSGSFSRAAGPSGQSHPPCPICSQGHLPSECKGRATEAQLRVALDSIASWPSSSTKTTEKMLLKAKLKARSTLDG